MGGLPSGTVTFLFTDIEGSTRLLRAAGEAYRELLNTHRALVRDAIARHNGHEIRTEGDSFFVAFALATDAVAAAFDAQRALCGHSWPDASAVRVRMGVHTGEASVAADDYVGLAVHQAARVSSAAHGGQVLLSEATRNIAGDALPRGVSLRDLGTYRLKDIDEPQRLFQIVHDDIPDDFPASASVEALPGNLPEPLTSFVGRVGDLDQTLELLRASRVLTLTGAGGVGKTRLGLELARRAIQDFPDGAWFVDLAPIAEPDLVAFASAAVLGIHDESGSGGDWCDVVVSHLRDARALLVLDNCEHLLGACADLATAILRACPHMRLLVTTREPLGLEGEVAWRIPSLAASDDAVTLFIERARDWDAAYEADDPETIVAICEQLDGIPLAIELAAARTQVLAPAQILSRLSDRFQLLRGGGRRRVERQQTLRATVDWSYQLLDEAERSLLRRLSVFAGGFTLDRAETVCADGALEEGAILGSLESLTRKSLVSFEAKEAAPRYRMLETIRQYALEKLIESGEATEYRTRHRAEFCALAEQFVPRIRANDDSALDEIDAELDNIRSALEWSPPGDDGSVPLRICSGVGLYFEWRSSITEGMQRTTAALERDLCEPTPQRAEALQHVCTYAFHTGRLDIQRTYADETESVLARVGDWPERTLVETGLLINRAMLAAVAEGDVDSSLEILDRAAALARTKEDPLALGWALSNSSTIRLGRGDVELAEAELEEARAANEGSVFIGNIFPSLALVKAMRGDFESARAHAEDGLTYSRRARIPVSEMRSLSVLSQVALRQGDVALARASAEEHLALSRTSGEVFNGLQPALFNLAKACVAAGDLVAAAAASEEFSTLPATDPDDVSALRALVASAGDRAEEAEEVLTD